MKYKSSYPYIKGVYKRKRAKRIRLAALCLIVLLLAVKLNHIRADVFGSKGEDIIIDIPNGATSGEIVDLLKENGVIYYPRIFKFVSKKDNAGFQMGQHALNTGMSYKEVIRIISQVSTPLNSVTVTIPEGMELWQTAEKLANAFTEKGLAFDKEVFLQQAESFDFDFDFVKEIKRKENRLEGYLFPATYTFDDETTEIDVLLAMLNKFSSEFGDEFKARAKELGLTVDQVVTLASIVEREGASVQEFKTVSGVFHNRLKQNMKLQSCATVQYILKERKPILSTADTQIKSPYNTYLHAGLPIGPIAAPGAAAISAALYPEDTDYLYFVLKDGKHIFSRTFEEHQRAERSGS